MKKIVPPYDEEYSLRYNERWPESSVWKPETDFVSNIISTLVKSDTKWLDAGCGTGYFLKQFKGVFRAGFDFSETMLDVARKDNPEAFFLDLHDISEPKDEWNDKWNLVTCIGQPWSYLDNISLIEKAAMNMAKWTSRTGNLLLVPDDIQDGINMNINYFFSEEEYLKIWPKLNAIIWSFYERNEKHLLIYPFLDQWVRWFSIYFAEVRIEYKMFKTHTIPRVYILCGKKKLKPDKAEATIFIGKRQLTYFKDKFGENNLNNQTLFTQE